MKLYDYAARGRPVVTTRWGAAVDEHPPPRLRVADDPDAFAAGVADAAEEPPGWREERRAWARAHTWEQQWPRWAAAVFGSA
jgi:Glycosyl transferases group 1